MMRMMYVLHEFLKLLLKLNTIEELRKPLIIYQRNLVSKKTFLIIEI